MATAAELKVWEDRWDALDKILCDFDTKYDPDGKAPEDLFPRQKTVHSMIRCLRAFARSQFNFFYNGFIYGILNVDKPPEFPMEYALQAVLAQVTYDLEIILRAADQRRSENSDMIKTLDTADKLAWKALQFAKEKNFVDNDVTVLTYFQKSPAIRLIPYAKVAVIGIPFSSVTAKQDYLSVAHEIGHYVYRNGFCDTNAPTRRRIHKELRNELADNPEWVKQWQEEIFADVYGCLVGGPVTALSAQDLAYQASAKEFSDDDKEHPEPIIRPDIYAELLPNTKAKLDKRWADMRAKRIIPEPESVLEHKRDAINKLAGEVKDFLSASKSQNTLVQVVKNFVFSSQSQSQSQTQSSWTRDDGIGGDFKAVADHIIDDFNAFVSGIQYTIHSTATSDILELESCSIDDHMYQEVWKQWVTDEGFFDGSLPEWVINEGSLLSARAIEPGTEMELEQEQNNTWINVLLAGGWTTKIGNHNSP